MARSALANTHSFFRSLHCASVTFTSTSHTVVLVRLPFFSFFRCRHSVSGQTSKIHEVDSSFHFQTTKCTASHIVVSVLCVQCARWSRIAFSQLRCVTTHTANTHESAVVLVLSHSRKQMASHISDRTMRIRFVRQCQRSD